MGAWGVNILEEDNAADVYGEYIERFNAGEAHEAIVAALLEAMPDEDERVSTWLGLAKAQWDCGALAEATANEVRRIVETGDDLDRWGEPGDKTRAARERALRTFLAKLAEPNPRPKKRRKGTIRKPIFKAGDCLAIRLSDGDFGAAIVTAEPPEAPRPGADTYGINVVILLNYKSPEKPTPEVFERRQILKLTHHSWKDKLQVTRVMAIRFKAVRDRFEVICRTAIRPNDPTQSNSFSGWEFAEQVVLQHRWDAGDHSAVVD
ncbi:MAG: hypothetical protein QM754_12865 [Tepidisphaeraceae bacterium]